MNTQHNERSHAIYGPSSAKRWISCPGSPELIEKLKAEGKIKPRKDTGPADRGTLCPYGG